ncbi:MAG: DUF1592 domain-containing protein [Planctomycetota bacterium]
MFEETVQPILASYCFDCHSEDFQEGDVQLDGLNPNMVDGPDAGRWHAALDMINRGYMPPDYSDQMEDDERRRVVEWMTEAIDLAKRMRAAQPQAEVRRLTREQYSNSLAALLDLPIDFGRQLPEEAKSKLGYTNSGGALVTSPLHVAYFESIARAALDKAAPTGERPEPHRYRVTLGTNIGRPGSAAVITGYQSAPVADRDVLVEILDERGRPRGSRNAKEAESLRLLKTNIGVGLRGSSGDRYRLVDDGMVLFSALPHVERAPKSWQGPSPNMKMLLRRCFPPAGPFVTRVVASLADVEHGVATNELLQLRSDAPLIGLDEETGKLTAPSDAIILTADDSQKRKAMNVVDGVLVPEDVTKNAFAEYSFVIKRDGVYHLDLVHPAATADAMPSVSIKVGRSSQHLNLETETSENGFVATPLAHARLTKGRHKIRIGGRFFVGLRELAVTPLPDDHPAAKSLHAESAKRRGELTSAELRSATLRAFVGSRGDDGMDYETYDRPRVVDNPPESPVTYEFRGYLENLPIPILNEGDNNPLSGIMVVGVWNDHLVKKPTEIGAPILVRSIEFEGPCYPEWPPKSYRTVFFDSPLRETDQAAYTRQVLERFLTRAFREPVDADEVDRYLAFWQASRGQFDRYEDGVKEVLVAALCSPRFLYLSPAGVAGPGRLAERTQQEAQTTLAERLSYFLWNAPPDEELMRLARAGELTSRVREQTERLIADPRVSNFVDAFTTDWLRLDRHAAMDIDVGRYPDYSRFVKRDMALETQRFVEHVLRQNLSLLTFVDSDFAMLNQNLAEFYGVEGVEGGHFRPTPVAPEMHRGGLLSQGAFLAGHSDGRQAHPIKRAVWLKSRILGEPPPPPPPNVPELDSETPGFQNLTLKEQLELHRDKAACRDCHRKIDPYGVVFENYDAVGRFQTTAKGRPIDVRSELPDGAEVNGVDELKAYLLETRSEQVVRSVVTHLYSYSLGRDATFDDERHIESIVERVRADGDRMQTAIVEIINAPTFLGSPAAFDGDPLAVNQTNRQ